MAFLKTSGIQNGDMVIFFLRSFQKSEILKNEVSGRWCLDSKSKHITIDYTVFPFWFGVWLIKPYTFHKPKYHSVNGTNI